MKILLNVATHGNEKLGTDVAKEIEKLHIGNDKLIVQIANKKAFELNKRCIDQDLNRSFPGKNRGNYEERLAYKLSPIIKSADLVIDIHSTTSSLKDTVIVTKSDNKTMACVKSICPRYAIIMNAGKNNALISQAKIGIAFEYGKENSMATVRKTILGIKRLFNCLGVIKSKISKPKTSTQYFNVISAVPKPKGYKLLQKIKNYKLVKKGSTYATKGNKKLLAESDFYPVLFREKEYKDIFGFKAKKLNAQLF